MLPPSLPHPTPLSTTLSRSQNSLSRFHRSSDLHLIENVLSEQHAPQAPAMEHRVPVPLPYQLPYPLLYPLPTIPFSGWLHG